MTRIIMRKRRKISEGAEDEDELKCMFAMYLLKDLYTFIRTQNVFQFTLVVN